MSTDETKNERLSLDEIAHALSPYVRTAVAGPQEMRQGVHEISL